MVKSVDRWVCVVKRMPNQIIGAPSDEAFRYWILNRIIYAV